MTTHTDRAREIAEMVRSDGFWLGVLSRGAIKALRDMGFAVHIMHIHESGWACEVTR